MRKAKTTPASLYVAWVDFKKDFDSVGHLLVAAACKRWGLPSRLTEYIVQIYRMASSTIDGSDATTNISSGVLQGDPLSPYFFNICLDWALSALPDNVGVEMAGQRVQCLVFADDVALCASSRAI